MGKFLKFFRALTLAARRSTVSSKDTHAAQVENVNGCVVNPRRLVSAESVASFLARALALLRKMGHYLTS